MPRLNQQLASSLQQPGQSVPICSPSTPLRPVVDFEVAEHEVHDIGGVEHVRVMQAVAVVDLVQVLRRAVPADVKGGILVVSGIVWRRKGQGRT